MEITIILATSIVIQLAAAYMAFRLVSVTRERRAWILISVAILLMVLRRSVTLFQLLLEETYTVSEPVAGWAEWITLTTSIFMLLGLFWIAPLFASMRRWAEELQESEIRYRTLFEAAQDAILVLDEQGVVLSCNAAAETLFSISRKGIVNPFQLSPELQSDGRHSNESIQELTQLTLQGKSQRFEWVLELAESGKPLHVDVTLTKIALNGKEEILAVVRDISRQKMAQEQLEEESSRLAAVLDGTPVPSFMINSSGDVILWNRTCEMITRMSRKEVLGKPLDLSPLFGGKKLPVLAELLLRMSEDEVTELYGGRRIRKRYDPPLEAIECKGYIVSGGARKTVRVIATRIKDGYGKLMGVIQCAVDITKEEELQRQLLHMQKMEAIGQLAGGIAHDFNNILMAIMGHSELALNRLDETDPLYPRIVEINKAGERASSLTRQLLAFSRKQLIKPELLDINAVTADIEAMLHRLIREDIFLVTDLDPDLWSVRADPGQIGQVILNLAVNARDAMPGGGKVTIKTANEYLSGDYTSQHLELEPGHYAVIAVSDNGMGMDRKTQSRIFEPFFTTKEIGKGTGLGLSTVYGIVQQSGGHISVQSEPGRGTTFKIYLPRAEDEVLPMAPDLTNEITYTGTQTIMLVEDDDAVRNLLCESLRTSGYRVLDARHGDEAISICMTLDQPIHLVITDLIMPGMNGREFAGLLLKTRPETRVLFMSGYSEGKAKEMFEEHLMFLPKPFIPQALLNKVRQILGSEVAAESMAFSG